MSADVTFTLGEIKRGREIGYKSGKGSYKYIWYACPDCGKERWVKLHKNKPSSHYCVHCASIRSNSSRRGNRHSQWKGGRVKDTFGYIKICLDPNAPFSDMRNGGGYVLEHRLLIARQLGRSLLPSEEVHHLNGIRDDNRLENLQLVSRVDHNIYTNLCKNCELRKEIRLLRWQVKELNEALQEKLKI